MLSSKPLTRATGSALSAVFRRIDAMMGATIATSNDSMEDDLLLGV